MLSFLKQGNELSSPSPPFHPLKTKTAFSARKTVFLRPKSPLCESFLVQKRLHLLHVGAKLFFPSPIRLPHLQTGRSWNSFTCMNNNADCTNVSRHNIKMSRRPLLVVLATLPLCVRLQRVSFLCKNVELKCTRGEDFTQSYLKTYLIIILVHTCYESNFLLKTHASLHFWFYRNY